MEHTQLINSFTAAMEAVEDDWIVRETSETEGLRNCRGLRQEVERRWRRRDFGIQSWKRWRTFTSADLTNQRRSPPDLCISTLEKPPTDVTLRAFHFLAFTMSFDTPLRYPGGKGRLSQYVAEVIETNGLTGGAYCEPFCGGAGIAISLLLTGRVRSIFLNDADRSVYAFWLSITKHTDHFLSRIREMDITIEEWFRQKAVQERKQDADILELGISTFFLNRTNRSGILSGGVIGGKNQQGIWKIDARFRKDNLIDRITRISEYRDNIYIHNQDAIDFIEYINAHTPDDTLVYFDPPYFNKGQQLYKNHFASEDHANLADAIQTSVSRPWIVSYDNTREIADLYARRETEVFSLNYSAHGHHKGSELMIFCDSLVTPERVYISRAALIP